MTTITIALPKDVMSKLQELAERASVEELVASPEESFQEASNYVLQKNKVLYKRIAI
jgi:predicted transcriptional regulator